MDSKIVALIALALAACGGASPAPMTLSARVGAASTAAVQRSASGGLTVAQGLSLDRARVAVKELRVRGMVDGADVRVAVGPLLVDVAGDQLGTAVQQIVDARIPPGTYDRLKLEIEPLEQLPQGAPAGMSDLVAQRASILLEGTVDGAPFAFPSQLSAELESEASFVVGGSAANLTVNLDPTKWFVAADGSRLDPRDPANRAAIEANLRAAVAAFQDDDESGEEDHNDDHRSGEDSGSGGGHDDGGGHR